MMYQEDPNMNEAWVLSFDGLCEPNPGGWMSWGWTLTDGDMRPFAGKGSLEPGPENTNNVAEWFALGFGLRGVGERIADQGSPKILYIRGDSNLVINQMNGTWACNKEQMAILRDRCTKLLHDFGVVWEAQWIARDWNKDADEISREAYKLATGKEPTEYARR